MKRMKQLLLLTLCAMLLLSGVATAADGSSNAYQGYTFDFFGNIHSTPAPFLLTQVITSENLRGIALDRVDDVCTSEDGRIFIADSRQSRVHVLDSTGTMVKTLKTIRDENNKIALNPDGSQLMLNGCEGVFYHEKAQELYIADTQAQRVIVLDGLTYTHKRTINRPEDMTGVTEFKPSKVVVDNADRIYLVVQSSYEGIIELNEDGTFSRYFGVNEPQVNLLDYFWKSIASDEQKAEMGKQYAPAFNNIALDGEGFIMAVTNDSAASEMVYRLNFKGEDVLRNETRFRIIGDLYTTDSSSAFTDLAVNDTGTYVVVDKTRGHIFMYNFDGEMLCAMGSSGNLKGDLKNPSAVAWLGDKLVIGDADLKCVYIFEPTEFGTALLRASESYYRGRWEEATTWYEEVLRLCGNLETAYTGIGKNYLMQEDYEQAMYYFKLGNNHEFYSKAYKGYRSEVMRDHFGIIAAVAVVLIGAVLWSEVAYHRKVRRQNK